MGAQTRRGAFPDADKAALDAATARAMAPLGRKGGDLESIRQRMFDVMWDDVGILRTADGLARGRAALDDLWREIQAAGVPDPEPRFNLTWTDRLNLENLIQVSRTICAAAQARTDSRGAHFREDHPTASELATSRYTMVRFADDDFAVDTAPVAFTRVRPGESLLPQAAE